MRLRAEDLDGWSLKMTLVLGPPGPWCSRSAFSSELVHAAVTTISRRALELLRDAFAFTGDGPG